MCEACLGSVTFLGFGRKASATENGDGRAAPTMRSPPGLRRCAAICGSFCGTDHGQEKERPAARAQGSAAARATGRGHASDGTRHPRQAAESAEAQEEIGGAGIELGEISVARAISGLATPAAIHFGTS